MLVSLLSLYFLQQQQCQEHASVLNNLFYLLKGQEHIIPNVSSDISEEPDVINNEQNSSQTDNEPGPSSTTNYSSNNEDCVSDTSDTDFDPENIPDDLNVMMENGCIHLTRIPEHL